MREQLELLWELQKIDLDLKNINEDRERYPREMKKLDEKQHFEKERIQQEREKLETLEKDRRQKERDLVGEQDKIKRSEGRMSEVKTNKEYQALLSEIETFREAVSRIEEEILLVMDEIDQLKKDLSKREKEITISVEKFEAEKKKIQERMVQDDLVWKKKQERKESLSKQIESKLFKIYNTLKEKRLGIGMVCVKHETCHGCFVNVPPQMFIEVQKNNSLIRCPNCNRILYWEGNGEKR
ncbi:MAG: C4-type zinc ribbon domain-containing protein [Thermodesulfobacteriota bacterium]|nr:C4-type zinc ribbon domain-containing protein [Thermodesulfobacteriota bacterium]